MHLSYFSVQYNNDDNIIEELSAQTMSVAEFLGAVNSGLKQFKATVEGEITGRVNRRGNVTYFSIHDLEDDAVLQCMGFNSILDKIGISLEQGMTIQVSGYPEIWKRTGGFSFKAFQVQLKGEGLLMRQFEALKRKLELEGLFSEDRKKALPKFIQKIGLITSVDREAQADFLKHLPKRDILISLFDVRVEGPQAVSQICNAIRWFNEFSTDVGVLVLTRGGGSLENLQAFNSEDVARAIYASKIPTIVGVGHEKDYSIADFVADVRASTPTHAAKIIAKDWELADSDLGMIDHRINSKITSYVVYFQQKLESTKSQ